MIPKKVHFIWLGGNPLDKQSKICINAAKRQLPDYTITVWTEKKFDLNKIAEKNIFLKKCLEYKLWAFAVDYLRLYVLYNEGGIYLDTDVEVIKSFDDLLNQNAFIGMESTGFIGTGIIGSEPRNPAIKEFLDFYTKKIWNVDYYNNPIIFTKVLEDEPSLRGNISIYPIEYFSPYDPETDMCYVNVTENTYTIHWYNANWNVKRKGYVFLNTKQYRSPVVKSFQILKKNIGYFRRKYLHVK